MYRISYVFTLLISLWSFQAQSAVPDLWGKTTFAYDADNTSLEEALSSFATTFGVNLKIDGVRGVVEGKLRAESATDFLNRLGIEHQFLWFVYNNTLYISSLSDQITVTLDVSRDAVPDLKEALKQVNLLDDRFGWGELPDEGIVIVSGPSRYIDYIRELSKKKKSDDERFEVMVFPLKYALVDDRSIKYREKTIEVPGVASILQTLLEDRKPATLAMNTMDMTLGSSLQALESLQDAAYQRAQSRISGIGDPSGGFSHENLATKISDRNKKSSKIGADIRNNAVLIMDDYEKKDMYQELIDKLDQPRNVIEIDAIILDIDKNKLQELGINWRGGSGRTEFGFNTSGTEPFLPSGSAATVLIQDFGHFFAQIRALETDGHASLIANPSILTIENQLAVIDFNNTVFISSIGERVANIAPVTAGTSLQVVPRLISNQGERLIQLSLDIEDGGIESGQEGSTPSVSRGSISTQAVILADRSLVVGGFRVERNTQQYNKVPLLGDIPGLDKLFSYTNNNQSKRERLFIITPRLMGNEVNPLKYISSDNREILASTINEQNNKLNDSHNRITRNEIAAAFTDLIHLQIPEGFTAEKQADFGLDSFCRQNGPFRINKEDFQWYKGVKFNLVIGTVANTGLQPARFNESSCSNRNTLAVSIQPNALLQPGQSAEVMLAVRLGNNPSNTRTSLIARSTRD